MSAQIPAPLIAVEGLAEPACAAPSCLSLLDVRWQLASGPERNAYLEGHIPGAVFVDLDRQLSDPPSERGRHPLPGAKRFTAEMQALGVSARRPVVVYDAAASTAAARAWWLLRYFGHPQVAVLDGGLAAWVGGGHPLQRGELSPPQGDFVARPGGMALLTAEEAAALPTGGILLDARAPERFHGLADPVDAVAGHIPGAVNRPTTDNIGSDGRFLDVGTLRTAFESVGVNDDVPVAAYCGSGITATHELLALELAGYRAALYPGSWSEWITDPTRPVARDPIP